MTRPKWRFCLNRSTRFPQRLFLARARNQHPNLFRRRNRRVTQRNAPGRRFGRIFHRQKWERYHGQFPPAAPGNKRRHVAVLAHAEKNQIQNRLAGQVGGRDLAEFRFGLPHGDCRRLFTAKTMNLVFRNFQRREQQVRWPCLKVAFRITWRNATLVRPEKMDVGREGRRAAGPDFRALACSTTDAKNFCAMRPPESATQCSLPTRLADSISSSHAPAAARASSSAVAKEISSNFFI